MALKPTLKRGALLAAANWPLVLVQFLADSVFKLALAVPVLGGALLVGLLLGGDVGDLLAGDLRERVTAVAAGLLAAPLALAAFLTSLAIVLVGGSALLFLVKGGTVTVLAAAERSAGAIEQGPVQVDALARTRRFSVELFTEGCRRLFPRYLRLGITLIFVYVVTGGVYLLIVLGTYQRVANPGLFVGWTVMAAVFSGALLVWITLVNLFYLLVQMIIAVDDVGVRAAFGRVFHFLGAAFREVAGVFGIILVLVVLATLVSLIAAAGFGMIAFVPIASAVVLPLQFTAYVLRGLVFEYIGLTALGAYLTNYHRFSGQSAYSRWIRSA